jgi:hypothetical protein
MGVRRTTKTSKTSPKAIELQYRRLNALTLRQEGKPYRVIAEELGVSTQSAYNYVCKAMEGIIPAETAQHAPMLELQRLDQYQASLHPLAIGGDQQAVQTCLKVMAHRARLLGLFAQDGQGVTLSFGEKQGKAELEGIQIRFVESPYANEPMPEPGVNGVPERYSAKVIDYPPRLVKPPTFENG